MIYTLPSGKQITVETSWDDGCKEDMRIYQLLIEYGLPGTFYIPTIARELTDDQVREISKHHEIGAHTETHRVLRLMHPDEAEREIVGCKFDLGELVGREINKFCYPKGKYNESIIKMVQAAGFHQARTVDVLCTYLPEGRDDFRRPTTVHAWRRREYSGTPWLAIARGLFDRVMNPDTMDNYFHLWGHGWEIEKMNDWETLEVFMREMNTMLRDTTINMVDHVQKQLAGQVDFRV